jgi:uncharacterized membrane protein
MRYNEPLMFRQSMRGYIFSILTLVALSGCLVQTQNSVNGDAQLFAPVAGNSSKDFIQVHSILKKNCVPCHAGDIASYSEAQCVSEGMVVPKLPYQSKLFQRLKGSISGGDGDMPQSGSALSAGDIQTIRNWIDNMGAAPQPTPTPTTPFGKVQAIIKDSCVHCHADFGTNKEADFVASGDVVPGDVSNSYFYQKLIGSGSADADMPLKGPALTPAQLLDVRNWINGITPAPQPSPLPSPSLFQQSQVILHRSCVTCHKDFKTNNEADFVTNGYVVAGQPSKSDLYVMLIGSGETFDGPPTMPKKGQPLTADEIQVLNAWIAGMTPSTQPSPQPSEAPSPTPSASPSVGPSSSFAQAQAIMNVSCKTCHSTFVTNSESDFISQGLVIPGLAAKSALFARIIGSGETIFGTPNMPMIGNHLTAIQLQVIQDWINGISMSAPTSAPSAVPSGLPSQP